MSAGADNGWAVEVEGLRVELLNGTEIVDDVSFRIAPGEVLGLVGESGSGKTTVGLALLGHSRRGVRVAAGRIVSGGRDLLKLPTSELRSLRGRDVSYVPQDPSAALNPNLRIETQLMEVLETHRFGSGGAERRARIAEMLAEVVLPSNDEFLHRYPHQLSGGQQQRVALAMAFACRPAVIVLDEPTTGLDVTTQAHVLETVRDLCRSHRVAALYVSHDLAVVAALADRVAVMYAGRLVEVGTQSALFRSPAHPYTRRLVAAIPEISGDQALVGIPGSAPRPGDRPDGCFFAPRCSYAVDQCFQEFPPVTQFSPEHEVRCFRHRDVMEGTDAQPAPAPRRARTATDDGLVVVSDLDASYGQNPVLQGIDLTLREASCVALVGESGSGKTTLARCIVGIHSTFTGEIAYRGAVLPAGSRARDRNTRRQLQYIFQSPYSSLNPRKTIRQIIEQPLRIFFDLNRREKEARVRAALERVALTPSVADRYPHHLSGGERQRVAIARALAAEPSVLVCDEITSALDVSVQAAIVDLIGELQREMGLALLFVTHNLALIRTIAEEVAVMSHGEIVEYGPVAEVLDSPQAEYTKQLLADTPTLDAALAAPSGG
jgi:peptide/nickel transport system ATP-binding protein